jgi:histidinol-phosphate aminotransferase
VLDEAYDTFIDVDDYPYGIDYLKKHNVIALKTFSKGYGLAGLRIGYAIVPESLSPFMERGRQPFNVNILAQAGAAAAIGDKKFLRETRRLTLEGKYYLYGELEKLGLNFVPSVTNFILVDVKRDCKLVFRQLLKLGIIVRDMKQYKMDTFIRVSIGTMAENRAFVSALKRVLRGK